MSIISNNREGSMIDENPDFRQSIVQNPDDILGQLKRMKNEHSVSFSDSTIDSQHEQFINFNQQFQNDLDIIDMEDQIFQRTLLENELIDVANLDNNRCYVDSCQKKFGIMAKKHQCKFCGHLVCDRHGMKHRPDPEMKDQMRRICVVCEDKYLKRQLDQEFYKKKDAQQENLNKLEAKQAKVLEEKKAKQKLLETLMQKVNQNSGKTTSKKMDLNNQKRRLDNEIDGLKDEFDENKEKLEKTKQQIDEYKQKIEEKRQKLIEKQSDEKLIQQKIQAAEQDIETTHYIIDEIEKKISENNYRIEQMKVNKNNIVQQQIEAQKQQQYEREQQQAQQNNDQSQFTDDQSLQSSVFNADEEPIYDETPDGPTNQKDKEKKKKKKKPNAKPNPCGVDKCEIF